MPRPCEAKHPEPVPAECPLCWWAANCSTHQAQWGLPVTAPGPAALADWRAVREPDRTAQPANGPGTELKRLIRELGITGNIGCGCESLAGAMDQWGVAGCAEHREEILARLRENAGKLSLWEKLRAAATAILAGLPIGTDPAAALLDEALRRAEQRE